MRTHEAKCWCPDCAYERGSADERARIVTLAHELGAMYRNPCGEFNCPGEPHYGAFAARIESET